MPKVLITARYFAVDTEALDLLRTHGCELVHAEIDWTRGDGGVSEGRAIELLQDVDAAIISSLPLTDCVILTRGVTRHGNVGGPGGGGSARWRTARCCGAGQS